MATTAQKKAAKKNVKKAQTAWKNMSKRQHSKAQPEGRSRKKPGTKGEGDFYRIVVRPKEEFKTFRTQKVGRSGHTERLAGKRSSGSWDTEAWLISKDDAHVSKNELVIDDTKARSVLKKISGPIKHVKGDIFEAHPRRNIPESEKPTPSQRRAQMSNIKKAQEARRRQSD